MFNGTDRFFPPQECVDGGLDPNAHPHIRPGLFLKVKWSELCASFWRVYKQYATLGQNDPALWGSFSQGDSVLDYVFSLFRNNSLVLELASPEVGAAGVEGDDTLETSNGTRAMTTSRGKRKRDGAIAALDSLVESSASMAASAATYMRCAEMVSLSTTLKNLRECHAAPSLIKAVVKQLEDVVLQRTPTSVPDDPAAKGTCHSYGTRV
ncbi:hypothetical protein BU14_0185s0005 [Porphyra umbilicalis]|uniref:Uncharacterized protein n=1 Tax=Porphyra umbilicalis TaxID=2786 RepID=A0A1X6P6S9_PORUM|nr:hypothetical protein BU14_0185s0005 [Porphyra umbilicalis]|eukprot:OSX76544.1 hypothetical protein BU14_0185s0005 [Porphyra umbilicalis]